MNTRRLLLYLGLNVLISAAATLTVLWLWERAHPSSPRATAEIPVPVVITNGAPAALPTPAVVEPAGTPTLTVYVVQSGDTLGSIAVQYDVSIEDLMAANGLTDPNVLDVGQVLIIPIGGYVAPTATAEPLPTNTAEPPRATATRTPSTPARLAIREVKAAGDVANETVVIVNLAGPADLAGWTVRDESGHLYIFPSLILFEGGAVNLHTAAGTDTVTDLHWGQTTAVWASGRAALLSDPNGNLQAKFVVP